MDLFMIYDAWEDGRSNGQESKTSEAARYRLGTYLKEDILQALTVDFEQRPLPIQYAAICWARGAEPFIEGFKAEELIARIKNEAVLKAYRETQAVVDEYLEESKGRKAFKEILWAKGWPVFKELIDKYIEEEAEKRHQESKKKKGGEEKKGGGAESGQEKGQGEEGSEKEEKAGGGEKGEGEKEKEQGAEEGRSWDELSEEEKEQLRQEIREQLDKEEKKFVETIEPSAEIKENADGTIEIVEHELTEEEMEQLREEIGKMEKAEEERGLEVELEKEEAKKAIQQSLEKLKERETGLSKGEREFYDRYYLSVKPYIKLLVDRLDEVFPPKKEEGWETGYSRGKRVDVKRLAR